MALAFRDRDALQVVLASGLCPVEVQTQGARVADAPGGGIVVAPDVALSRTQLAKLRDAGVTVDAVLPDGARAVRCWAEAIAPVATPLGKLPALVVFVLPDRTPGGGADHPLVDLAAELLRLGCDRVELLVGDRVGIARVIDPPTYTVMRGLDREGGMRAFAPDPPGQEAVWTELGHRHPLALRLRAAPGTLLLVAGDRWLEVPNRGWLGIDAALELAVPGQRVVLRPDALPAKRRIELRLAPGRRDAPSMWVIRNNGVAALDRMLDYLPEEVVARLTFAASRTEDPVIIVRARGGGRHPPPDLALDAEPYAPYAQMPDLYAPASSIVEPPLRRERLRAILGIESGDVMWLAPTGDTRFRVERIADAAFEPLADWADYVVHAHAAKIQPWMVAGVFDFTPFVSTGLEWGAASAEPEPDDPERKKRRPRARPAPIVEAALPVVVPVVVPAGEPVRATESPANVEVAIDAELAALEAEFVTLDAPGDAPERLALLERLARAYARLRRRRDAGLCFARAAWEATAANAEAWLDAWIAADLGRADAARTLPNALASQHPDPDDIRLVAVLAARRAPAVAADPHRVTRWLDDHDGGLDTRTLWLARLGLARLAGGDPLALAHARDRVLGRLAAGLPVELEFPAFLRFAGRSGALGNATGEHLGNALGDLAGRITKTKRKRSPVEADVVFTNAYASLVLGHGFARIGMHERARELVDEARRALARVATDPVHAYLQAAFSARIDQAIAGLPAEAPLPESLGEQLAALDRVARYKVDRLREVSRILEPFERFDVIGGFLKRQQDARGPEFAALRQITELGARIAAIDALVDHATTNDAERERLIDGIFDVLLELPEAGAAPILIRTWPLIARLPEPRRAVLYAEALVVAGHFGRAELVPGLLELLGAAIRRVTGTDLDRVLDQSLRALRRIGLRAELADLLASVEQSLAETRADTLRARLALAAGLAYLGEFSRAQPIFDQARQALGTSMLPVTRLDLTRALALAYAQAPLHTALAGIVELSGQLRDITDTFMTNSHYCLSVIHFVESLVLGIASDDLALGETGRRFVEDDEHLIRRRLFRDLGGSP